MCAMDSRRLMFVGMWLISLAACPLSGLAMQRDGSAVGTWHGAIDTPGRTLEVSVTLAVDDGNWTGAIDIPLQNVTKMPLTAIEAADQSVAFSIAGGPGSPTFTGQVSEDGVRLVGTFRQGSASFPFELERVEDGAALPSPPRPQDPRRPFPYDEEEVTYRNEGAGISLAGTLTLPRTAGPSPAVMLITPGGPQDRDATVMGHKRFLVLADYLTRRGLAVLRVDDRGVGGSGGGGPSETAEDFAGDVLAGVRFLKSRSDIDSGKIGLIGHSAGRMVPADDPDQAPVGSVHADLERVAPTEVEQILCDGADGVGREQELLLGRTVPVGLHDLEVAEDVP